MSRVTSVLGVCVGGILTAGTMTAIFIGQVHAESLEGLVSYDMLVTTPPVKGVIYLRAEDGSVERRFATIAPQESSQWIAVGTLLRQGDADRYSEYCFETVDSRGVQIRSAWNPIGRHGAKIDEERESVAALREHVMELRKKKSEEASVLALLEEEIDLRSGGGDLVQLRARVAEREHQKQMIEDDIRLLRESLQRVALLAAPARATTRERELVQHIAQLADKVSDASGRLEEERAHAPQTREELESRIIESHAVDVRDLQSLIGQKEAAQHTSELNGGESGEETHEVPAPEQPEPSAEPTEGNLLYEYD